MLLLLLLLPSLGWAASCPPGTRANDDPYAQEACVPAGRYEVQMMQNTGFTQRPHCPQGSRPVPISGALGRFRCAPLPREEPARPDAPQAPVLGSSAERREKAKAKAAAPLDYRRFNVPGEIELEYPAAWSLTNAWNDEVPTLYIQHDAGAGRAVTLSVSRNQPRQPGYQELEAAVTQEKRWGRAKERAPIKVAGRRARLLEVPGESRTVYLPIGGDAYYAFIYSAPEGLFKTFEPVFERLMRSLRLENRGGG